MRAFGGWADRDDLDELVEEIYADGWRPQRARSRCKLHPRHRPLHCRPARPAGRRKPSAPEIPLYVTAITVNELTYGAYKSERPADNLAQVNTLLDGVTTLAVDLSAARRCGEIKDLLCRAGTPIAEPDLQIASIALQHGWPLVTHNAGTLTMSLGWPWLTGYSIPGTRGL